MSKRKNVILLVFILAVAAALGSLLFASRNYIDIDLPLLRINNHSMGPLLRSKHRRLNALGLGIYSLGIYKDPHATTVKSLSSLDYKYKGVVNGARHPRQTVYLVEGAQADRASSKFENELGEYKPPKSDQELPPNIDKSGCVLAKAWHKMLNLNCNSFHEIETGMTVADHNDGNYIKWLASGGRRDAWEYQHNVVAHDRVVIKIMRILEGRDWSEHCFDMQRQDATILERLSSSPHLMNTYGLCGTSTINEFAGNGNLEGYLIKDKDRYVSPEELLSFAKNISIGIADVHDIGLNAEYVEGDVPNLPKMGTILHNDFRTFNLLMTADNQVKLSDFNAAILLRWDLKRNQRCGFKVGRICGIDVGRGSDRSPEECAREEYEWGHHRKVFTQKIEVWHLGTILHLLLTRKKYPYVSNIIHANLKEGTPRLYTIEGRDDSKTYDKSEVAKEIQDLILVGELPVIPSEVDVGHPAIKAIIQARNVAMTFDEEKRPRARDIANMLIKATSQLTLKEQPKVSS
eukprot:CAMPEP_0183712740 /NCGR_PEP_ID=MMETSP0737-20130205/7810_1 /TAXON_ID=385413 /ORGANISM="Thalassiosira miniscula, Strain CCMP1093" /LENGTH=517 /DNA_ID=CAMNT_0025941417 /DNA_START=22 /DNA_END=1575 /DNA_ORIENTATION=-